MSHARSSLLGAKSLQDPMHPTLTPSTVIAPVTSSCTMDSERRSCLSIYSDSVQSRPTKGHSGFQCSRLRPSTCHWYIYGYTSEEETHAIRSISLSTGFNTYKARCPSLREFSGFESHITRNLGNFWYSREFSLGIPIFLFQVWRVFLGMRI